MIRKIIFILTLFASTVIVAQKAQKLAYIDMQYILDNVPEYVEAESRLNAKVITWQQKLDAIKSEIETLKTELNNEKALLTDDLIEEKQEDIEIKELDLKNLQAAYFGPNGDMFFLRQQLVKPVQDQIYNAVQEIAVAKKYDFVVDRSSDLLMLYANNQYDISELVLSKIVKGRKVKAIAEKKEERIEAQAEAIETAKTKAEERNAKNEALREKIRLQNEAKAAKRAEAIKAKQEARQKRLDEIARLKKEREEKIKQKQDTTKVKE
ncbi:OmpH family outer membrane protein [Aureibaculum sp. 2210JD6-5]|uniref:OmpH family outer membrane protein n=1 Tax=Aureibaculum sp. 2210JD6-5 TaxID=3103957 RepID=UPI002AACADE9|nr:OmpH family outer membrane protein [Aureibaculum sp. 2210JD6-5]MDY7396254.1 OmpH family outer membrane protein [Aureibaculum sp. 2210JD6-5]